MWRKKEKMKQHDWFFNCLFLENLRKINKRCAAGSIHTLLPLFLRINKDFVMQYNLLHYTGN